MDDLYPDINDPDFNIDIAKRKEFNEQSIQFNVKDVVEESDKLCSATFELTPHQQFVKNFLSINTPYNSLLLFHGLGTGKTCSAIGISEEMRSYMKQMGITKKIIIVASPNVQENFKQQLFDERKMEKIGGIWNIKGCSGMQFLSDINPINLKGLSKEKIIKQVDRIIRSYYLFMGYGEFANYISKRSNTPEELSEEKREELKGRKLRNTFENRLIIIDEVHNIRSSNNKKEKKVASRLEQLVKYVKGLRLVLLTATPMYNDPREIIWLINLMNKNDRRSTIDAREVFDKDGNFMRDQSGTEVGKDLLMRKARGYVSFVKGDNPYTFPYRIFPHDFKSDQSLKVNRYPTKTLLGGDLLQGMEYMDLFCTELGPYQSDVYELIIQSIKDKQDTSKLAPEMMERFGYTMLQKPLEALNMVYPTKDTTELKEIGINALVGIEGLERVMKFKRNKSDYEYREDIEEQYGRIFAPIHLGKYSSKLKSITKKVVESEGICLVYSQFLDGGVIPLAIALEEMGCQRYGAPNLLKTPPKKKLSITYTLITGSEDLSPNNALSVKTASDKSNVDGSIIKIVIISRAGSEGLDFANIRQVHILEPWYNTNRIEQTIGRAVRNCSHKLLPFKKRNVMIFLYTTLLKNGNEAADMYVYRVAELKAILIGRVARALKEGAIDCLLNKSQQDSTEDKMKQKKRLELSNGETIMFTIGDKPFTQQCDYMEKCSYTCSPTATISKSDVTMDTYFIPVNNSLVIKIKDLFKEHYFYKKSELVSHLQYDKPYSLEQIYVILNKLVEDKTEVVEDRYGRAGNLINIGEYYLYQPLDLDNTHISLFDRSRPIDYKRRGLVLEFEEQSQETIIPDKNVADIIAKFEESYNNAFTLEKKRKKSDKDWYKNAASAIVRLEKGGMKKNLIEEFIIQHIWDTTPSGDKLQVLNHLFREDRRKLSGFKYKLNHVVDKYILLFRETKGIYLQEGEVYVLYVWNSNEWVKGEKTDNDDFTPLYVKEIKERIVDLSEIYGFIIPFKSSSELIFKTKVRDQKRQSGARCDQASKKETIKTLNAILKSVKRDGECPTEIFSDEVVRDIGNVELCCYTELVLRCYNYHKVKGKVWFVTPEYAQKIIDHLKN
jgi:superfamily II DNA or RNA helicase